MKIDGNSLKSTNTNPIELLEKISTFSKANFEKLNGSLVTRNLETEASRFKLTESEFKEYVEAYKDTISSNKKLIWENITGKEKHLTQFQRNAIKEAAKREDISKVTIDLDEMAKNSGLGDKDTFVEYVEKYEKLIKKNETWSWDKNMQAEPKLTQKQRDTIKQAAITLGLLEEIPMKPDKFTCPDFEKAELLLWGTELPEEYWDKTDKEQFKCLDNLYLNTFGHERPPGTTWHHSDAPPGAMELVPFGYHNMVNHKGGRATWCRGKRK